jgi:hypothetical protein
MQVFFFPDSLSFFLPRRHEEHEGRKEEKKKNDSNGKYLFEAWYNG